MQHSGAENKQADSPDEQPGQTLAVAAEVLYLLNLLLLPGIAFIILLFVYFRYRTTSAILASCHLRQTMSASLWAGVMLVLVNGLIIFLGGYNAPSTWVVVILYFTTIHATLILLGTLGLAKAMAGKHYHYPLVGRVCSEQKS
jgi:uncharacterized Tic20 family protein